MRVLLRVRGYGVMVSECVCGYGLTVRVCVDVCVWMWIWCNGECVCVDMV